MAERWDQINSVFLSVVGRDASDRASFLAAASAGDEDLQRAVESLLAAYDRASRFLARSPVDVIRSRGEVTQNDSSISQRAENRHLTTACVRAALELPVPARPGWLNWTT